MKVKDLFKVIVVNFMIAFLIILTYGIFGLSLKDESTIKQTLAIVLLPVYLFIFFRFNYLKILKPKMRLSDINDKSGLVDLIHKYYDNGRGVFDKQILLTEGHINRFDRRKESLSNMLYENFQSDSEFGSMTNLVSNAEETFTSNVQQIIKRISIFDFDEYAVFCKPGYETALSSENYKKKDLQFKEHISYVCNLCNKNEELLLELDNLITEVSRINDSDSSNLSNIKDTVDAMKQLHFSDDDKINSLAEKYN